MTILGIESSCDETSAAVFRDETLLSNVISSQFFHSEYGGVVPELASRAHLKSMLPIVRQAMLEAGITLNEITAVAATQGPGLIGSLLVGLNFGKALAISLDIPFIPVHHIEAHLFSTFLHDPHPDFPFLGLVVSGGHTMLIRVDDIGVYTLLGGTIDDAAGEAFDKVAKMLGLGYPGGREIDRCATSGDPEAISFPRPLLNSGDYRFSFSGLKTSVLYHLRKHANKGSLTLTEQERNDICASFQRAIVDVLLEKCMRAAKEYSITDVTVVGGVSANSELQRRMYEYGSLYDIQVYIPDVVYSTDNAAMVARLAALLAPRMTTTSLLQASAFARSGDRLFRAYP
ncbi:MAG: tRNA (adenosine(37)-N6)-threonylcarbamoyltransferase complex transferase subunit TsaD [Bacteroidetes bacterium]|nr:tRNA (adenosine(37)-N6)-threonylcarbamoyltransferase complex transferase subunit TsaD [Bacteroidota bacterium]